MLENGFEFISFDKIKENDYNLVGTRYRQIVRNDGKWKIVNLEDVALEIKNGISVVQDKFIGKYRVSRIESIADGNFNIEKTNFTDDEVKVSDFLLEGDILFSHINSYEHLAKTAICLDIGSCKVIHGINLIKIRPNPEIVIPKYLSYVLKSESFIENAKKLGQRAVNQASIGISELKLLQIPLPPLLEQQKLVEKLDAKQKLIRDAENLIKSLKKESVFLSTIWE